MQKKVFAYSSGETTCYFDADFSYLEKLTRKDAAVIVTDENISRYHAKKLKGWRTIIIKAGERFKTQDTVNAVVEQLLQLGADRQTLLIGFGGGVVTDITGYAASIYMRGIRFGFVPSSVLAMVDASIGGKNGVDIGLYKNAVGLIRQPEFLLYDLSLLRTLPKEEWINGFAEIIKHAAIKDSGMFRELQKRTLAFYRKDQKALSALIRKNVRIKCTVVQKDEFEKGDRKLLNFGHTLGHAIENLYGLSHGHAISIGMAAACLLSEQLLEFKDTTSFVAILHAYGLPSQKALDTRKVFDLLKMDKKKAQGAINYILLKKIGQAVVKSIPVDQLEELIRSITMAR